MREGVIAPVALPAYGNRPFRDYIGRPLLLGQRMVMPMKYDRKDPANPLYPTCSRCCFSEKMHYLGDYFRCSLPEGYVFVGNCQGVIMAAVTTDGAGLILRDMKTYGRH